MTNRTLSVAFAFIMIFLALASTLAGVCLATGADSRYHGEKSNTIWISIGTIVCAGALLWFAAYLFSVK